MSRWYDARLRASAEGADGEAGQRRRPSEIRAYYEDPEVVEDYLRRRTAQPLNGLLHRRQVRFLNALIAARRPARLLEVAPGPARLTAELAFTGAGIGVDSSAEMLGAARARLADDRWLFVHGDAFQLPVADHSVDLALTFRFIRRFAPEMRQRLYAEIRRVLRPGGALVIDAQNRAVSLPHRQRKGLDRYPVYDALYTHDELVAELDAAGFRTAHTEGLIRHFGLQSRCNRLRRVGLGGVARQLITLLEHLPGGQPSTWLVVAEVES